MMGAAFLPTPQGSTPAGFAAFLSTIGQTPGGSGEDGGFEQLLAAVPKVDGAAVKAAPAASVLPAPSGAAAAPAIPAMTVTPAMAVTPMMTATPVTSAASEMPMTPVTPAVAAVVAAVVVAPAAAGEISAPEITAEAPIAMTRDGAPATDADAAAASAAKLLIALNGSAAKPETKPLKALDTEAPTDGKAAAETGSVAAKPAETAAAPETLATTPAPPPAALSVAAAPAAAAVVAAVVVAAPGAAASQGKPVKASEPGKRPVADAAPTAATVATAPTADKPRSAEATRVAPEIETAIAAPAASKPRAAPQAGPAVIAGEAGAAKPAEAAPAMTVQFAQPTTAGAAPLTSASAPVSIAERVLDLASDGAWIDQLAHDIAATKSDSGDISFRLMPRHLGRLDVAMLMGDEGVALKLDTQHEATATIVTAAQGRLVEDLRQQGVRVTGSEVTCTPGDTGRQMQGQSQGQGRGAAQDVSHLIETVTERVKARDPEEAADRRGRFA